MMNPRITSVQYQSPHTLVITFANHEVKEFNYSGYLKYPVYEPLKDESLGEKAKVYNGTVIWDNVIDFDPDTLYIEGRTVEVA